MKQPEFVLLVVGGVFSAEFRRNFFVFTNFVTSSGSFFKRLYLRAWECYRDNWPRFTFYLSDFCRGTKWLTCPRFLLRGKVWAGCFWWRKRVFGNCSDNLDCYPTTVSDGFVSSIKDCVAFKANAKLTYMIICRSLVSFKFEGVQISEFPVIKWNFFHFRSICILYHLENFELEWNLVDT